MSTYVIFHLLGGFAGEHYSHALKDQFPKDVNVEALPRVGETVRFDDMPNNSDYSFRVKEVIHLIGLTDGTNRVKIYLEN